MFDPLITVDELSKLIRKSVPSIYSDLNRNPSSLPPSIRLPGSRRVLFHPETVKSWIAAHTDDVSPAVNSEARPRSARRAEGKRRRGRPTKESTIAKRQSGGIK